MQHCVSVSLLVLCTTLQAMILHRPAPLFWQDTPGYFEIIKQPMDLGTVLRKLKRKPCGYGSVREFEKETKLTFSNCVQVRPYAA